MNYFKTDYLKRMKCPKLSLRTSGDESIGLLQLSDKPEFELNANDLSVLKFTIHEKLDGKTIPYYDRLNGKGQLIYTEKLGVYRVVDNEETRTGKVAYKEVVAKSREYDLKGRQIFDISGVFYLYSLADTSKSLMHIICNKLGNWEIGHVDNELVGLARTFDIDSSDVYGLLTDSMSTKYEAIFTFDTYNCRINAYSIANFGKKVNVLLSYRNLVQQNIISTSYDSVSTVYRVRGGDNIDIRSVNPTGLNTISNFDAFMIPKSEGGEASDGLVTAWNTYKAKYESLKVTQSSNIETLKTYQTELLELQTKEPDIVTTEWTQYGLDGLNSQKSAYQVVLSALLSNGAGSTASPQYAEYSTNYNTLNAILSEISVRESQIASKNAQITDLQASIFSVASQLSEVNNFTADQIKEMCNFKREGDFTDSTYIVSENDSEETTLTVKQQLFDVATADLVIKSQPQFTIDTTLNNLFALPEFESYQNDFLLGNVITIKFSKDYIATARLLSIKINFNNPKDLSVVFANRNKLDNSTIDFAKIQKQASQTSNAVSVGGAGWDKAASQTNKVNEYMIDALNLATQELWSSDKQEFTIGAFGARCREMDDNTGLYDPEQLWITKNKIVYSDDSFASSKTCFGKYSYNGNSYYGLLGGAVVSPLVISENMFIYNTAGNFSIKNDTGFTASATVEGNTYSVGINPSAPSEIFNIKVNGANQLYVDTMAHSLVYTGNIIGSSINVNNKFLVDNSGILTSVDGIFSGKITALSGNIGGFTIDTTQLTAGTTNKFMRISPYSTTPGTNNYSTTYGSIDLGRTSDGLDTLIHLRSDGYARFGLNSQNGSVKFNYTDAGGTSYSFYTPNFKIESGNGFVTTTYIRSASGEDLMVSSTNANLSVGADYGTAMLYGDIVQIYGYNGSPLTYNDKEVITSETNYHGTLYAGSSPYNISAYFSTSGNFVSTNANTLGTSSNQWVGAYLGSPTMVTSDRNKKFNIQTLDDKYYQLFLKLIPVSFQYIDGQSGRTHIGFISQDVETAMQEVGLTSLDFAGFVKAPIYSITTEDGEYDTSSEILGYAYFLRYEEFIAINTYVSQKQGSKLLEQDSKLLELEERIIKLESV